MRRDKLVAVCAYALSALFAGVALLNGPPLLSTVRKTPVEARGANEVQELTASFVVLFIRTTIDLNYQGPARKGSSETVTATINQVEVARNNPGYANQASDDLPHAQQLDSLQWPIEVTLRSAAFKFAPSEEGRKLPKGTHLPVTVVWAPIADSEGDANFTMHLSNINGSRTDISQNKYLRTDSDKVVSMTVNGKTKEFGVDDDVPLPISVYTVGGFPAWLWTDASVAASIIAFIFGSAALSGLPTRLWAWITGKPLPRPADT